MRFPCVCVCVCVCVFPLYLDMNVSAQSPVQPEFKESPRSLCSYEHMYDRVCEGVCVCLRTNFTQQGEECVWVCVLVCVWVCCVYLCVCVCFTDSFTLFHGISLTPINTLLCHTHTHTFTH